MRERGGGKEEGHRRLSGWFSSSLPSPSPCHSTVLREEEDGSGWAGKGGGEVVVMAKLSYSTRAISSLSPHMFLFETDV